VVKEKPQGTALSEISEIDTYRPGRGLGIQSNDEPGRKKDVLVPQSKGVPGKGKAPTRGCSSK